MPADYETDPECRWIEQFVREAAPAIYSARCGNRLSGDYELWLQLLPASCHKQVLITRVEYKAGQGEVWKEKIKAALEELNS